MRVWIGLADVGFKDPCSWCLLFGVPDGIFSLSCVSNETLPLPFCLWLEERRVASMEIDATRDGDKDISHLRRGMVRELSTTEAWVELKEAKMRRCVDCTLDSWMRAVPK